MARRGRTWTTREIDRLFAMRDRMRMKWLDIARDLGRCGPGRDGPAAVCAAYIYWKAKFAREAEMRAAGIEPPKRMPRLAAEYNPPIAASPFVAASLAAPVKRPRYFHDADAFVTSRIARQGITAGLLGDPPPGRSALDRRGE